MFISRPRGFCVWGSSEGEKMMLGSLRRAGSRGKMLQEEFFFKLFPFNATSYSQNRVLNVKMLFLTKCPQKYQEVK